ncbi:MAG: type I-C CRISPR-associated protein Cas8c/Csd1 [Dysosmobacter sp.]|nr:type I-C CRISPR-associated protein Cas8c/Csd1 [Dysosmobacter sp.]
MILQALADYYEALAAQGKIALPGWGNVNISYALCINGAGELEQAVSLKTEQERGKSKVLIPRVMELPAPVNRTVKITSNFLWDNSTYILGIDNNGKPERSLDCFRACRALHRQVLSDVDSPAAKALLAFFDHWEPQQARIHPALSNYLEDMLSNANLTFWYDGRCPREDPLIRQAWQDYYNTAGDGPEMVCLVTGKTGPVEPVHPFIKGSTIGAQAKAALVSFNAPAFCSYGREQNLNAPVSKYAAFAYTTALNHLLADREHTFRTGDTTVLFWAKNGQSAYQNMMMGFLCGMSPSYYAVSDLAGMVKKLCNGQPVDFDGEKLDPNMDFYILGLSPNAARLSVRFFLHNSFGVFLENVRRHYERLEIVRPAFDKFDLLPLWKLLDETVNQNARDKSPSPQLAGETLQAIMSNTRYPATLLNGVTLRIRAEREITRGRAAILKAYYLQAPHPDIPKPEEVLTVSLNPDSSNTAYNLGRLFSVLESIQSAANPGINTTIKDKYFNSASAAPSRVFPTLVNLAQKHLRKLETGLRSHYNKQLTELQGKLNDAYPDRMNLPQQGSFQLGYYHQTQIRYMKKEEKENV